VRRDLRCPVYAKTMFARLDVDTRIVPGPNLIEVACRDCRNDRHPRPTRVLHRYNLLGDWIETEVVT
jgi:hypothetical protein